MCQVLTIKLEGLLHELLFQQSTPLVPLLQLVDSIGTVQQFQQKGYSFVDHLDNTRQKVSQEFLQKRILQANQKLVSSCGSSSSSGQLKQAEQLYKVYLAHKKQFLLKLIVAIYIIGGQPIHSPEISSIKVQNSIISSWNIFMINRRVIVVTIYNKAYQYQGKIEYIFCYFPDQLSQVLV